MHWRRGASDMKSYIQADQLGDWKYNNSVDHFDTEHRRIYKKLPNIPSTEKLLGSGMS